MDSVLECCHAGLVDFDDFVDLCAGLVQPRAAVHWRRCAAQWLVSQRGTTRYRARMGAEASSTAAQDAREGKRPCKPPSKKRLMKDAPDVKLIVEPRAAPPGDDGVDRSGSLAMLCDEMKCHEISHSSRFFIDHLLRVSFILEDWGCDGTAVLCGLFHSVYGTASFSHATLKWSERDKLRAVIGDEAEELVYMFCTASAKEVWAAVKSSAKQDAPETFELGNSHTKGTHRVSARQLAQLAEVKLANQAEQGIKVAAIKAKITALEMVAKCGVVSIRPACLDAMRLLLRDYSAASPDEQAVIDGFAVPDADVPPSQSSADELETKTDGEEEEEIRRIDPDGNDKLALFGISEDLPPPGQVSVFGAFVDPVQAPATGA